MSEPIEVATGVWWRFDRYELHQGYIRPALNANLEMYEPWDEFELARKTKRSRSPLPYQALFDLLEELKLRPSPSPTGFWAITSKEAEAILLDWCKRYGLLGILPHQALTVTLAARWRTMNQRTRQPSFPAFTHMYRTSLGWRQERVYPRGGLERRGSPPLRGSLVQLDQLPAGTQEPHVILQDLQSEIVREESLLETWRRFFPSVPLEEAETFDYPQMLSEEFWFLYAEPLDDFVRAAWTLRDALANLAKSTAVRHHKEKESAPLREGLDLLHALVSPVRQALDPLPDRTFRQRWVSPSLLGSFATMALEAVSGGARVLLCRSCGIPFVAEAYQALYCSNKCRYRGEKRAQRARKHETN